MADSSAAGPAPARRRIGPWVLGTPLGSGNAGIIYRAQHEQDGTVAAVKTLRDVRARQLGLIRREIFALSQLDHPGVVAILDHGQHDGVPWYAMAFLPHPTLREWLAAHDEPEAWPRRIAVCARLAHTLAYLHDVGLVHGDIKPDNVIVTPAGQPVLVDFGLAVRFRQHDERASLDLVARRGTPAYVAPEQIAGHGADHRSDLYSMGCLLFEACTGQLPFSGSLAEVLRAQREQPLPDPGSLNPGIPPQLAATIAQLTTKDVVRRTLTASVLAARLDTLQAGAVGAAETVAETAARHVHRPVLRGREDEAAMLAGFMSGTTADLAMLLRGASGIGKTFLVAECCRSLPPHLQQVTYSCRPEDAQLAELRFAPLRALLEQMIDSCVELGATFTSELFAEDARLLALLVPRLLQVRGTGATRAMEVVEERGLRSQFAEAFARVLVRWCARRPLLLVIDDAQWLDPDTRFVLDALPALWKDRPDLRVLLIACDDLDGTLPTLPALAPARMELAALTPAQLQELTSDLLGLQILPAGPFDSLFEAARGNPLYVAEYVRAAVDAGNVTLGDALGNMQTDTIAGLPMPGNARDIVRSRLQRLTPEAVEMLGATIALERLATHARLEAFSTDPSPSSPSSPATLATLSALVSAGFVEEAADGRLGVHHHHYEQVFLADWPDSARESTCRRVADCLEAEEDEAGDLVQRLGTIARCRQHSGEQVAERKARERAAEAARGTFDFRSAVEHVRRALELDAHERVSTARGQLLLALAESQSALGASTAAAESAVAALATIGYHMPSTRRAWSTYAVRRILARPVARFRRRLRHEPDRLAVAYRSLNLLSQEYFFNDNLPGGLAVLLLNLDLADANPGTHAPPRTYGTIGALAGAVGLTRVAEKLETRGRELVALEQEAAEIASYWLSCSVMHANSGRWGAALAAVEAGQGALEGVWNPVQAELLEVQRGHVQHFTGNLDAAERTYAAIHARATAEQNNQVQAWCEFSMARSQHARGDHAQALELLQRADARMSETTELQSRTITTGLLASVHQALGQEAQALAAADRCAALLADAVPTGFPTLEAFSGALDVIARRPERRAQAMRLLRGFRRFVRTTPCAAPRHQYGCSLALAQRHPARAAAALERGMNLALDMGMRTDAARCAQSLLDLQPTHADGPRLRMLADLGNGFGTES